jgi:segregation and condensation protein B
MSDEPETPEMSSLTANDNGRNGEEYRTEGAGGTASERGAADGGVHGEALGATDIAVHVEPEVPAGETSESTGAADDGSADEDLTITDEQAAELRNIVEALIFASDEPISTKFIRQIIDDVNKDRVEDNRIRATTDGVKKAVAAINRAYADRAFHITPIAGGFVFATKAKYSAFVGKLAKEKARRKLSATAIESLAIIAYKQPLTKSEVEFIRGVNADYIIKTLLEKNLITITGRASTPGRPLLYGTTDEFLKHFGLNEITDLPKPREIEELIGETELEVEKRMLAEQQELEFKDELSQKMDGGQKPSGTRAPLRQHGPRGPLPDASGTTPAPTSETPAANTPATEPEQAIETPAAEAPAQEEQVMITTAEDVPPIEPPATVDTLDTLVDESVADETETDEPVVEMPDSEDPAVTEAAADEPALEDQAVTEAAAGEPVVEDQAVTEVAADEPAVEDQAVTEAAADEPAVEDPAVTEAAADEPAVEDQAVTGTVDDESAIEETPITETIDDETAIEPPAIEERTVIDAAQEEPVIEEPVIEEPVIEEPAIIDAVDVEPAIPEPETAAATDAAPVAAENEHAPMSTDAGIHTDSAEGGTEPALEKGWSKWKTKIKTFFKKLFV